MRLILYLKYNPSIILPDKIIPPEVDNPVIVEEVDVIIGWIVARVEPALSSDDLLQVGAAT